MKIGCWRKGHSLSCPYCISPLSSCLSHDSSARFSRPPHTHHHHYHNALSLSVCVSLSHSFRVMTAAPRCVRKLECHVLTGVRGMLTGQTERTDGSVTCPRSSGMPLLGSLDLKPNTLFACFLFSFFRLSPLPHPNPPIAFTPSFIHSFTSISHLFITFAFLFFIPFPFSVLLAPSLSPFLCLSFFSGSM